MVNPFGAAFLLPEMTVAVFLKFGVGYLIEAVFSEPYLSMEALQVYVRD